MPDESDRMCIDSVHLKLGYHGVTFVVGSGMVVCERLPDLR